MSALGFIETLPQRPSADDHLPDLILGTTKVHTDDEMEAGRS